jgi:hypothetical protein
MDMFEFVTIAIFKIECVGSHGNHNMCIKHAQGITHNFTSASPGQSLHPKGRYVAACKFKAVGKTHGYIELAKVTSTHLRIISPNAMCFRVQLWFMQPWRSWRNMRDWLREGHMQAVANSTSSFATIY